MSSPMPSSRPIPCRLSSETDRALDEVGVTQIDGEAGDGQRDDVLNRLDGLPGIAGHHIAVQSHQQQQ
jgi:hypothetical protein